MKNIRYVLSQIADYYYDPMSLFNSIRLKKASSKTAILIGTPIHYNLGDHLIAANEIVFLKEKCNFENIIEIPTRVFLHNKEKYIGLVNHEVPVFITGGGWMGDVWPEDQKNMETIIDFFSENCIFVFPQTIFYNETNTKKIKEYSKDFLNTIKKCRNITFFCRDYGSFSIMHELESDKVHIIIAPDIGLYIRTYKKNQSKLNKIGFCLRNDREKTVANSIKRYLKEYFCNKHIKCDEIDTIYKKKVPLWKRNYVLENLKNKFASYDLIITDRLHGMIFSYIVGTNCVAFNNSTNKVKGVYELWIGYNSSVRFIDTANSKLDLEDALTSFTMVSKNQNTLNGKFDKMAAYINESLDKE